MAKKVFVSYRRKDTGDEADYIYKLLVKCIGKRNVFKDTYNIGAGTNFKNEIDGALTRCDVMLVLIGEEWEQEFLNRRDNVDYVKYEIHQGLTKQKSDKMLVIPVLVNRSSLPEEGDAGSYSEMESIIKDLCKLDANQYPADWNDILSAITNGKLCSSLRNRGIFVCAVALVLLVAGALLWNEYSSTQSATQTQEMLDLNETATTEIRQTSDAGTSQVVNATATDVQATSNAEIRREELVDDLRHEDDTIAVEALRQLRNEGWLFDGSLININLSNTTHFAGEQFNCANLTDWDFIGATLRRTEFLNAYLVNANFWTADLTEADLSEADLTDANFTEADLTGANLRYANLSGATLYRANLTNADLTGVDLGDIDLETAILDGAIMDEDAPEITPYPCNQ